MSNEIMLSLKREIILSYRKRSEFIIPLLFFILVAVLFPLATTSNPKLLAIMGAGVIWVAALLATLLSLNHLFHDDYHDGSLEQWILSPYSLVSLVLVKIFAQWLMTGLPLIIISPLMAMMFHLSSYAIFILVVTLLLGTPTLNLIGAIVAALTVGLRNGGVLLGLVLLPLYIPNLIFASNAVNQANKGFPVAAPVALLGALLILSLVLTPLVSVAALRIGVAYDR